MILAGESPHNRRKKIRSDVSYEHSENGNKASKPKPAARSLPAIVFTHSAAKQVVMTSNSSYNICLLVRLTTKHTVSLYYLLNWPAFRLRICDAILTFRSSAISLGSLALPYSL
jgi:hypothetical protein